MIYTSLAWRQTPGATLCNRVSMVLSVGVLWLPVSGHVQRHSCPVLKFLRFPRVELFNLTSSYACLVAWSHMPYSLPESMVFNALYRIMVHLEKVQAQDSGDDPRNGSSKTDRSKSIIKLEMPRGTYHTHGPTPGKSSGSFHSSLAEATANGAFPKVVHLDVRVLSAYTQHAEAWAS